MNPILEKIKKTGIVPVVVLNKAADAKPLAKALCDGGLPCAEVTFRTEAAEESIRIMTDAFPQMLVGAGTVLTTGQADRAVAAGAKFIVSPGLNPKVVNYCMDKAIPVIPGVSNPSDIEQAIELGLETVKFFPAESAGGLNMIKAMSAPYVNMKFMPTGGISEKNMNEYLSFPKVIACGGSWMVKGELVEAGAFDRIAELTKAAVMKMLGFELKHIGIPCDSGKKENNTADIFAALFGFDKKGHIAIGTNSVERAVNYLEAQGVEFIKESGKYEQDRLTAIYIRKEIAGFAVHLVQR